LLAGHYSLHAGHIMAEPDKKVVQTEEKRTWFPDDPPGLITVGGLFSKHMSGVYLDSITGLWASRERDAFFFLDSTYHYEDIGSSSKAPASPSASASRAGK